MVKKRQTTLIYFTEATVGKRNVTVIKYSTYSVHYRERVLSHLYVEMELIKNLDSICYSLEYFSIGVLVAQYCN